MELENVKLNKTARREEVMAFVILKDILFEQSNFFIGDNLNINMPDIYSQDGLIGAEVVTCETFNNYKKAEKFKLGNVFDNVLIKNKKKLSSYKPSVQLEEFMPQNQEYYFNLQSVLKDKLQNISTNHYSCHDMYLIVLSNLGNKKDISISQVFEICKQENNKCLQRYKGIFIVLEDKILEIDQNNNCKILKDFSVNKFDEFNK